MPDILAAPGGEYDADDIPGLVLLSRRKLDEAIRREMRASPRARGFLGAWQGVKQSVLGYPGGSLARYVKRRWPDRGRDFCERIRYCERRDWYRAHLEAIEEAVSDVMMIPEEARAKVAQLLEEQTRNGAEILDAIDVAKELYGELLEEAVDAVVPVTLVVKIVRYGLDELCDCAGPHSPSA